MGSSFEVQVVERMWVKDGSSFLLFVSVYIHDFHVKIVYPYVLYTYQKEIYMMFIYIDSH